MNHSVEFVNAEGHHTNNIEATWRVVKSRVPNRARNKDNLQDHLFKHMWRNQNEFNQWCAIIRAMGDIEYEPGFFDNEAYQEE